MKKYALIKNNAARQYLTADELPTIAANKGIWYEVNESEKPAFDPETEILESSGEIIAAEWVVIWTKRDKMALELWKHGEYAKRIVAPESLIMTLPEVAAWFNFKKLPIVSLFQFQCGSIKR